MQQAEISYDVVLGEQMDFVEGTYRLPGGQWQVFIVSRYDGDTPEAKAAKWDSGVTGVFIRFPRSQCLSRAAVEHVLGDQLGVEEWTIVRGPDSMTLR